MSKTLSEHPSKSVRPMPWSLRCLIGRQVADGYTVRDIQWQPEFRFGEDEGYERWTRVDMVVGGPRGGELTEPALVRLPDDVRSEMHQLAHERLRCEQRSMVVVRR